jgi:large subunit ribosomal protein L21
MTDESQTYAVVRLGGKQYRVKEGDELLVDRLPVEPGETMTVDPLLVHAAGKAADASAPAGAKVTARVVDHELGRRSESSPTSPRARSRRRKAIAAAFRASPSSRSP